MSVYRTIGPLVFLLFEQYGQALYLVLFYVKIYLKEVLIYKYGFDKFTNSDFLQLFKLGDRVVTCTWFVKF